LAYFLLNFKHFFVGDLTTALKTEILSSGGIFFVQFLHKILYEQLATAEKINPY